MKKNFLTFFIIFLFFLMLSFPTVTKAAANEGLQLWIFTILPALLPYTIISSLLLQINAFSVPCHLLERLLKRKLPKNEFFALICGCLCGCPIGAKISADLYCDGKLSRNRAEFLMCAFNNISPSFLINYVFLEIYTPFIGLTFYDKWMLYFIMIFSSVLGSGLVIFITKHLFQTNFITHIFQRNTKVHIDGHFIQNQDFNSTANINAPNTQNTFIKPNFMSILDKCIFSAFEIQVKIGGYIILFTIVTNIFIYTLNLPVLSAACFGSVLEVTSGLELFLSCQDIASFPFGIIPAIITALTVFGGICTIFQTKTVIADTDLSICRYTLSKLAAGIISFLLTIANM